MNLYRVQNSQLVVLRTFVGHCPVAFGHSRPIAFVALFRTSAMSSLKRTSTEDGTVSPPPLKRGKPSATTQEAVANFFTPASKKETLPEKITWGIVDESLVVGRYQPSETPGQLKADSIKVAGFDFDSTVITTSSGNVFGRDANDWKWWDSSVPSKLRSLYAEGYAVVIFSNQSGISLGKSSKSTNADKKRFADFKTKVAAVLTQLDIPISVYAATSKDKYRKPRTGMWTTFLDDGNLNGSTSLNLADSIFVGDAGGRAASSMRRKDFSCSDRNFAANIGITYKSPEEFFLGHKAEPFTREFDPSPYLAGDRGSAVAADFPSEASPFQKRNDREIVIFCGSPGAGKSTFYWKHLEPLGYERVNQDILKTRERCLKVAESSIVEKGVSIAVDNTNADEATRKYWVDLARRLDVPIRCILFTASTNLAQHNDAVRALNDHSMNPEKRTLLPKMAFTGFQARFRPPTLNEGFEEIFTVDFAFDGSEEQKAIWGRHWL